MVRDTQVCHEKLSASTNPGTQLKLFINITSFSVVVAVLFYVLEFHHSCETLLKIKSRIKIVSLEIV
jgi:hypothetical protein